MSAATTPFRISDLDTRALPKRRTKARKAKGAADPLHRWAAWGGWGLLTLSGLLNGFANALTSPHPLAAWGMGLVIPAIVLLGSRMAGGSQRRKVAWLAGVFGSASAGLLLLSVWHCAESISLLTGTSLALAMPMAVAIDVILIACELAAIYA